MDFIEFLKDCKINNKDLAFKNNSFIVDDKIYFYITEKEKNVYAVLDSEQQPTQYTLFKFYKNSEDWSIYGPRNIVFNSGSMCQIISLTGNKISVNKEKVEFYFQKPTFMEKWSAAMIMYKGILILAPLLFSCGLIPLVLIFLCFTY